MEAASAEFGAPRRAGRATQRRHRPSPFARAASFDTGAVPAAAGAWVTEESREEGVTRNAPQVLPAPQPSPATVPRATLPDEDGVVTVYVSQWTSEEILGQTSSAGSTPERWTNLHLSQDAIVTLPEFGFAQVMTHDAATADALGFCDAERVDLRSAQRTMLHRTRVGAPWDLVGTAAGSCAAASCDELVPLTSDTLAAAPSVAPSSDGSCGSSAFALCDLEAAAYEALSRAASCGTSGVSGGLLRAASCPPSAEGTRCVLLAPLRATSLAGPAHPVGGGAAAAAEPSDAIGLPGATGEADVASVSGDAAGGYTIDDAVPVGQYPTQAPADAAASTPLLAPWLWAWAWGKAGSSGLRSAAQLMCR